jgi:glutamyl-tRNA synthetase
LQEWSVAVIETALREIADRLGRKFRDIVRPLYIAVTGSPTSVPLFDSMEILGRDLVRERLRQALATLGGATSAEIETWRSAPINEVSLS